MTNLKYEYLITRDLCGDSKKKDILFDDYAFSRADIFFIENAEEYENVENEKVVVIVDIYNKSDKIIYEYSKQLHNLLNGKVKHYILFGDNVESKGKDSCHLMDYVKKIIDYPKEKDKIFECRFEDTKRREIYRKAKEEYDFIFKDDFENGGTSIIFAL